MPSADDYAWLEDSFLGEAACVTAVVGKSRESVLEDFGANVQVAVSIEDAYGNSVSVVDVPGGVLAIEYNGFQGAQEEVLEALSGNGPASSMFWNVNDDNAFSCARDGQLLATVDMYDAEDPDEVDLPPDLQALFELGADEDADLHALGLAMIEQFTGIKITPIHVETAKVAHPIVNK